MKSTIYQEIYEFCKVRNLGSAISNRSGDPPARVKFLMELLDRYSIYYRLDEFIAEFGTVCYNIILPGEEESGKMVVAHHDVNNPEIDNANDNSASVINAIALKLARPWLHVVLLDGEEVGGLGAERLARSVLSGAYGKIDWVLNLELTGKGGDRFFIGDAPSRLGTSIVERFGCPSCATPFNDSVVLREHGIDSCVINSLPVLNEGTSRVKWGEEYLDWSLLYNCHRPADSISTIDTSDMQKFVEQVLVKIVD
jgi:hypothetical protein